jgi:hypothetical protein
MNQMINHNIEDQVLTMRDQLIISQALCVAVKVLEAEPRPEVSNITDMKRLMEDKFPLWSAVEKATNVFKETGLFKETAELEPEEDEEDYRRWARDNYVPFTEVKSVWHPIVQSECIRINDEANSNDS